MHHLYTVSNFILQLRLPRATGDLQFWYVLLSKRKQAKVRHPASKRSLEFVKVCRLPDISDFSWSSVTPKVVEPRIACIHNPDGLRCVMLVSSHYHKHKETEEYCT